MSLRCLVGSAPCMYLTTCTFFTSFDEITCGGLDRIELRGPIFTPGQSCIIISTLTCNQDKLLLCCARSEANKSTDVQYKQQT